MTARLRLGLMEKLELILQALATRSRSGFVAVLTFAAFAWCFPHVEHWSTLAQLLVGLVVLACAALAMLRVE